MELVLDNSYTRINFTEGDEFKKIVEEELHYKLGVKQEGYVYSPAYKNGHWDGIIQFYEPDKQRFPTGLVPKVEEILGELQERINFTYTINDDRPDAFVPLDELPDKVTLLDDDVGEITLRDYQYDAFRSTLEHRMSVLHLATNAGKCITPDSVMLTSEGLMTLEQFFKSAGKELSPEETVEPYTGDIKLINRYGEPEKPSHLTTNGYRETKKIETDKGLQVNVTDNHPLLTVNERGEFLWKEAKNLKLGDWLVSRAGDNVFGSNTEVNPEEGYNIGALYADGYFNAEKLDFSNDEPVLLKRLEKYLTTIGEKQAVYRPRPGSKGNTVVVFSKEPIKRNFFDRLQIEEGVAKDKKVPEAILQGTRETQIEFLSGYLECEMSISLDKQGIEVTSASETLIRQVQLMLLNMGVLGNLSQKVVKGYEGNYYGRLTFGKSESYRLIELLNFKTAKRKQLAQDFKSIYKELGERNHHKPVPFGKQVVKNYFDTYKTSLHGTGARKKYAVRTNISVNRMRNMVKDLPEGREDNKEIVEKLTSKEYEFSRIASIAEGKPVLTFDVAMPETHSFIANGIINHNTEVAGGFIKEVYKRLEPGETIAFFTMSKEIFNQTHKRLEQRLGIKVGKYGAGKKDIKKVNVVMVPTISASLKIDPEKGVKLTAKERIVKKMAKDIAPAYAKGVNQKTLLKAFLMNFEAKTKADADLVFEIEKIIYESESDAKVKFKLNGYVVQYEKILEKKNEGKLKKKKDVLDFLHSIVAFVSDEHQHVSADSLYNTLLACENAIYRVGLSGSIDQKNKMLLRRIEAVTGKVTSRTTTEFLVEEGHSAKPYINLIPIYGVEENTVKVDISGLKEYQQVYESGIVRNEYRNKLIAKITEMCYNRDQGVLIVVNRIEHGDTISMLLDLLSVPHEFLQGEIVDEEREAKLSMMRSGELKVMIATSIMDEGVDISGIDVLIMGAGGKSLRQTVQRVGRAVRKKKGKANEAQIYDFYDRTHDYLYRHSKARHKIYEEERFDINFIE